MPASTVDAGASSQSAGREESVTAEVRDAVKKHELVFDNAVEPKGEQQKADIVKFSSRFPAAHPSEHKIQRVAEEYHLAIMVQGSSGVGSLPRILNEIKESCGPQVQFKIIYTPSSLKVLDTLDAAKQQELMEMEGLEHYSPEACYEPFNSDDKGRFDLRNIFAKKIAHWCDDMLILPATITGLGRLAAGTNENLTLLTANIASATRQVSVFPAAERELMERRTTKRLLLKVENNGFKVYSSADGTLAPNVVEIIRGNFNQWRLHISEFGTYIQRALLRLKLQHPDANDFSDEDVRRSILEETGLYSELIDEQFSNKVQGEVEARRVVRTVEGRYAMPDGAPPPPPDDNNEGGGGPKKDEAYDVAR